MGLRRKSTMLSIFFFSPELYAIFMLSFVLKMKVLYCTHGEWGINIFLNYVHSCDNTYLGCSCRFLWPRDLCYLRYWRRNDDGSYGTFLQYLQISFSAVNVYRILHTLVMPKVVLFCKASSPSSRPFSSPF